MIRNRREKNVLRAYCIGLSVSLALIFFSCAHYDYIGTWSQQPGTLTYINHDQHIKVTFPIDTWQVHTRPPFGGKAGMGRLWVRPTEAEPGYTVMTAETRDGRHMEMQIFVEPAPHDLNLEGILGLLMRRAEEPDYWRGACCGAELLGSEIIYRGGHRMGVLEYSVREQEVDKVPEQTQLALQEMAKILPGLDLQTLLEMSVTWRALIVVLKEKGRFATLTFSWSAFFPKKDTQNQFWVMVDSYEYIE